MIQIDLVRVHELSAYVESYDQLPASIVPIGKMRARAQTLNPCADPDDVALVVARLQGMCVGYAGLLPGKLATASGISKVFWTSTLYVDPRFRNQMVAVKLVKQILALPIDFVATWYNPDAGRVFEAMGCRPLPSLLSRELRVVDVAPRRLFSRVLARLGGPRRALPVQQSAIVERAACALARMALAGGREEWSAQKVEKVRDLPIRQRSRARFLRDAEVINWTLSHPWYEVHPEVHPVIPPSRYFFPEVVTHLHYEAREFYDPAGRYSGFWVARVRAEEPCLTLRITDWDLATRDESEWQGRRAMLLNAIETATERSAGIVEVPEEWRLDQEPLPLHTEGAHSRAYLYHPRDPESPLARNAGNLELQLGDGDYAFS